MTKITMLVNHPFYVTCPRSSTRRV